MHRWDPSASCYYVHIPKTAGLSVTSVVQQAFKEDVVCKHQRWEDVHQASDQSLERYRFFAGHLPGNLQAYLGRPLLEFTVLRDPVQRTLSQYYQFLRHHRRKNEIRDGLGSFSEFLRHGAWRSAIENFQVRYLADNADLSADRKAVRASAAGGGSGVPRPQPAAQQGSGEDLLAAAIARLDNMVCVGVTERLPEFLDVLAFKMGWELPQRSRRINVNPDNSHGYTVSAADRSLIEELTRLDQQAYARANKLLDVGAGELQADRKAHPLEWIQHQDRRIVFLDSLAAEYMDRAQRFESEYHTLSAQAGRAISKVIPLDQLLPLGSRRRSTLRGLKRFFRPRSK